MDQGPHGSVTRPWPTPRPRPRWWWSGAFCVRFPLVAAAVVALALAAPRAAGAQEPERPDTLPRPLTPDTLAPNAPDTVAPNAPDTLAPTRPDTTPAPADTVAPVTPPPPALVRLPAPTPTGWTTGVWEWDRDDLLRLPNLTLLQLLERVPGLTPVRPIALAEPEGVSVMGASLGAVRFVVDGYALDPLLTATFDPSLVSLLGIDHLRVERGLTGATVRIRTRSPALPGPESTIEAATGDYGINLFRGVFLAPNVMGGPVAAGFERFAAEVGAPSNLTTAWLKWSWARDSTGIQIEFRQQGADRSGVGPAEKSTRRDWAVRVRRPFGPASAEAYVGGSSVEDDREAFTLREATAQAGLRLAADLAAPFPTRVSAAARWRSHPRLPAEELELGVWTRPVSLLAAGAEATQQWWDGATVGRWSARAEAGPALGLTAFGEVFRSGSPFSAGAPSLRVVPAPDSLPAIDLSREGARAGIRLAGHGFVLGGAAVRLSADSSAGFGLPFDSLLVRHPAGDATGIEATARIPTGWDPLHFEGWYVSMDAPPGWLYLPEYNWRAALVYHQLPLPSGHLELYARAEHVFRGRMTVAAPAGITEVGAYRASNLELSVRVLTLTAFLRWDDVLYSLRQTRQRDFPAPAGAPETTYLTPGQHIAYGVKWTFTN